MFIRLKAGVFVEDLGDRFEISTITWRNLLHFEFKDLFLFPTQELVRKYMPKEFAQYATTRIIFDFITYLKRIYAINVGNRTLHLNFTCEESDTFKVVPWSLTGPFWMEISQN